MAEMICTHLGELRKMIQFTAVGEVVHIDGFYGHDALDVLRDLLTNQFLRRRKSPMTLDVIEVLDPRGVPLSSETELAERPSSLNEVRLGILSNSKPNGDLLLRTIQHDLEQRFHFTEVIYRNKGISTPAPPDVMEDLAQCDVVLNAIGD
jgi:hypothetical protein